MVVHHLLAMMRCGSAPQLRHAYSVRSPLFPLRALNDVVEADAGGEHFFVTTWLPFPLPALPSYHAALQPRSPPLPR